MAVEWNIVDEIRLLRWVSEFKPVGTHKHFHMLCILERMNNPEKYPVTMLQKENMRPVKMFTDKDIWIKLKQYYNLDEADKIENDCDEISYENELKRIHSDKQFNKSGLLEARNRWMTEKRDFALPWDEYGELILANAKNGSETGGESNISSKETSVDLEKIEDTKLDVENPNDDDEIKSEKNVSDVANKTIEDAENVKEEIAPKEKSIDETKSEESSTNKDKDVNKEEKQEESTDNKEDKKSTSPEEEKEDLKETIAAEDTPKPKDKEDEAEGKPEVEVEVTEEAKLEAEEEKEEKEETQPKKEVEQEEVKEKSDEEKEEEESSEEEEEEEEKQHKHKTKRVYPRIRRMSARLRRKSHGASEPSEDEHSTADHTEEEAEEEDVNQSHEDESGEEQEAEEEEEETSGSKRKMRTRHDTEEEEKAEQPLAKRTRHSAQNATKTDGEDNDEENNNEDTTTTSTISSPSRRGRRKKKRTGPTRVSSRLRHRK